LETIPKALVTITSRKKTASKSNEDDQVFSPVIPTSNQDGRQAKNRKKGG
jgi:hypothetical protein